jgi:serine/threonine-protein phosphatase 2B catalytic subunit
MAAVLNICTQEELNESSEEPASSAAVADRDRAERRKVIKNKILAVGRLSHMFSVLRYATPLAMDPPLHQTAPLTFFLLLPLLLSLNSEESERVSELKSISGSPRLPYGTLALGAEGIKNAIKSFDDACVSSIIFSPLPFVFAILNISLFVDVNLISITSACLPSRSVHHRRHRPRPHPVILVLVRVSVWETVPAPRM